MNKKFILWRLISILYNFKNDFQSKWILISISDYNHSEAEQVVVKEEPPDVPKLPARWKQIQSLKFIGW